MRKDTPLVILFESAQTIKNICEQRKEEESQIIVMLAEKGFTLANLPHSLMIESDILSADQRDVKFK